MAYLCPSNEQRLLEVLDLQVVVLLVVVLEGDLSAVVVQEGGVGVLLEVDFIHPVVLVVVSEQNKEENEDEEGEDPHLTWSAPPLPTELS